MKSVVPLFFCLILSTSAWALTSDVDAYFVAIGETNHETSHGLDVYAIDHDLIEDAFGSPIFGLITNPNHYA